MSGESRDVSLARLTAAFDEFERLLQVVARMNPGDQDCAETEAHLCTIKRAVYHMHAAYLQEFGTLFDPAAAGIVPLMRKLQ